MIKQFLKKLIQYYIDLIVSWYKIKTHFNLNSEIKKYHVMAARIPRKEGQPAKSKKHSDLYTDEDPKGTIQGLQFKNKRAAALSVAKIKRSNRSHNHKTQAAIAMEQRAEVAGKDAAASVYRKFIEEQKRKTKEKNA